MKILLTGANGFVGRELSKILTGNGDRIVPVGFSNSGIEENFHNLDLTDFPKTNLYFKSVSPDIILHLAGIKDVQKCEIDKALSRKVNYEVSKNLVSFCLKNKIKMIFISTDYVFPGTSGGYGESAAAAPTTQYGKDKLAVENLMRKKLENFAVARTAGIFGMRGDFVDKVAAKLKRKENFPAYVNLKNSPTYVKDLAAMLGVIVKDNLSGTFHCAGSESLSRYEFALKIAEHFNFDRRLVIPEKLDFSEDPRPADVSMDCRKTYSVLNYRPKNISEIMESSGEFNPINGIYR